MGVGGQHHAPVALPPGMTRYQLYRRLGSPGPVWTGMEDIAPTEIRSPDRPARSESLYRLSYPDFHHRPEQIKSRPVAVPHLQHAHHLHELCAGKLSTLMTRIGPCVLSGTGLHQLPRDVLSDSRAADWRWVFTKKHSLSVSLSLRQ
jgi:hypothetical protein